MVRALLVLLITCVICWASSRSFAEVIQKEWVYGCKSKEAYQIFERYILNNNFNGFNNALRTGECIELRYGQEVILSKGKGSFFLTVVRLPGSTSEWWIPATSFQTAIETEQMNARLDELLQQFENESRRQPPVIMPNQRSKAAGPKWRSVAPPLPVARGGNPLSPTALFKEAMRSVWAVVALRKMAGGEGQPIAQGSAVAIAPNRLATNCHVIQGADKLIIAQGDKQIEVSVAAVHQSTDRCVLASQERLPMHVRGVKRFTEIQVGERVFTVGSPRGLEHTLGDGLVSGLRRTGQVRYVQTSAPISPGSSGGGLFDEAGNLVGITTFMLQESQALNFAIAAEDFWAD